MVAPPLDKIEEAGAREYDLVIVGATGFTGGWAVRYMSVKKHEFNFLQGVLRHTFIFLSATSKL